jgi:hypothetical protein
LPTSSKRRPRHTPSGIELPRTDGRTVGAKRYRELVEQLSAELGGGPLSVIDTGLIRTAAAISLRIESLQVAIVTGAPTDDDEIVRLSSEHRRILSTLRAKASKRKPASPTLADYLARKAAEKAAGAADGGAA